MSVLTKQITDTSTALVSIRDKGKDKETEMALEYDLSAIPLEIRSDGEGDLSYASHALIWATAICRFPTGHGGDWAITEKNWKEMWRRISLYNASHATDSGYRITAKDVFNHIGLRTNAGTESDFQFNKRALQWFKEYAEFQARQAEREV